MVDITKRTKHTQLIADYFNTDIRTETYHLSQEQQWSSSSPNSMTDIVFTSSDKTREKREWHRWCWWSNELLIFHCKLPYLCIDYLKYLLKCKFDDKK